VQKTHIIFSIEIKHFSKKSHHSFLLQCKTLEKAQKPKILDPIYEGTGTKTSKRRRDAHGIQNQKENGIVHIT
jgi:hypothetical protein